jgi:polar amino acid transport system substrate-binding protein
MTCLVLARLYQNIQLSTAVKVSNHSKKVSRGTGKVSKKQILPILFVFFWLFPPAILAKDVEIVVSMGGGWPPYLIVDNSGGELKGSGILIDIFNEIVAQPPYRIEVVAYPEKRDIKLLDSGLIDFRFDGLSWVDHPERFYWTDPIIASEDVLVFLKHRKITFKGIPELKGKRIITHSGYTYPTFESFFKQSLITRIDAHNHLAMLKMLIASRGDAAVMNKKVALWVIKNNKNLNAKYFAFSKPVDSSQIAMLCLDKKWIPFIEYFNRKLSVLKSSGKISRIVDRYQ